MAVQIIDLENFSTTDGFTVTGEASYDYASRSISNAGDVNGDGIDDFIVGADGSDVNGNFSGSAYVIFGRSGTGIRTIDLGNIAAGDGFAIHGVSSYDFLGRSVSTAGDINGDGFYDLVVGAPFVDNGGNNAGAAYVIYGNANNNRDDLNLANFSQSDGFVFYGSESYASTGYCVAGGGDFNGDGLSDLIVVAQGVNGGAFESRGEVYVIYGKAGGARNNLSAADLNGSDGFVIRGSPATDTIGSAVANGGDLNGDGLDDIVIGARFSDIGASDGGAVFVVFGRGGGARPDIALDSLAPTDGFVVVGDQQGDFAGGSVSGAGDVNGDGIDDLIIGAQLTDAGGYNAGSAYVIFGALGSTRSNIDLENFSGNDGFSIIGGAPRAGTGYSVSRAGDVNGDGVDDIIVGSPGGRNGGVYAGDAYVIFGRDGATRTDIDLAQFSSTDGFIVQGNAAADAAGSRVSAAGDLNSDGIDDIIVGAIGADTPGGGVAGRNAGQAYVVYGFRSIYGSDAPEMLRGTSLAETISGFGGDDRLLGGMDSDRMFGGEGSDSLAGEAGNDLLFGGEGSDALTGGAGADTMNGEGGNDRMIVDDAGDVANGGDGIDTVQFVTAGLTYTIANDVEIVSNLSGGALTVTLNALANTYGGSATGADTVNAGDEQDSVYGRGGNDVLRGQGGNDYLFGEAEADQLYGGDGVDLLYGGADLDLLFGDAGNDTLYGEAGTDFLTGGAGVDQMFGGSGTDFFVFFDGDSGTTLATADRIRDFSQAQGDRIQLDGITAITGGALNFIGSAAFSNVAGQLRAEVVGSETRVSGDTNGDGVADFVIRVDGVHVLSASDFFF